MGIGTLGFLSGASKTALSGIERREEEDRQKRRDELLAKLQMDNSIKLKDIDRKYELEDAEKKITSWVQADGGKWVGYNSNGKPMAEREMTGPELQAAKDTARKTQLELVQAGLQNDNISDTIRSRRADDRRQDLNSAASRDASRASADLSRAQMKGLDSAGAQTNSIDNRAAEKVKQFEKSIDSLERQGLPRAVAERTITEAVIQAAAGSRTGNEMSVDTVINEALQRALAQSKMITIPKKMNRAGEPRTWGLGPASR